MMGELAFFWTTFIPMIRRPDRWGAAVLMGGLVMFIGGDSTEIVAFCQAMAVAFTAGGVIGRLEEERSGGTLEQLEMLPVPRWWIALQIVLGQAAAFQAYALPVYLMGAVTARHATDWSGIVIGTCACLVAGLLATLLAFRHSLGVARGALFYGASAACAWYAAGACVRMLDSSALGWIPKRHQWALISAAILLPGLLVWCAAWCVATRLGGRWTDDRERSLPVGLSGDGVAERPGPASLAFRIGVPDAFNPLLWRELWLGWRTAALITVAGIPYIWAGVSAGSWDGPASRASRLLFCLVVYACMTSSLRTSQDRTSGLWADLAVTPIRPGWVLASRILDLTGRVILIGSVWCAAAWLVEGRWSGQRDLLRVLLGISATSFIFPLVGFTTGSSGDGWVAAAMSVVLLYLGMFVVVLPATLVQWGLTRWLRVDRDGELMLFLFGLCALAAVGVLLWNAIRQVRQSAAGSRA